MPTRLLATCAAALLLTACTGGSGTDPAETEAVLDPTTPPTTTEATEAPATATASAAATATAAAGDTVEVLGVDYAFEEIDDTVPAGSTLEFRVDEMAEEPHEMVLFAIAEDQEAGILELLGAGPPGEPTAEATATATAAAAAPTDGPTDAATSSDAPEDGLPPGVEFLGVSIALPGEDGIVVEGDTTVTEPGRYAIVCFIPVGTDPEEFAALFEEGSAGHATAGPTDAHRPGGAGATEDATATDDATEASSKAAAAVATTSEPTAEPTSTGGPAGGPPHFTEGMVHEFTVEEGGGSGSGAAGTETGAATESETGAATETETETGAATESVTAAATADDTGAATEDDASTDPTDAATS